MKESPNFPLLAGIVVAAVCGLTAFLPSEIVVMFDPVIAERMKWNSPGHGPTAEMLDGFPGFLFLFVIGGYSASCFRFRWLPLAGAFGVVATVLAGSGFVRNLPLDGTFFRTPGNTILIIGSPVVFLFLPFAAFMGSRKAGYIAVALCTLAFGWEVVSQTRELSEHFVYALILAVWAFAVLRFPSMYVLLSGMILYAAITNRLNLSGFLPDFVNIPVYFKPNVTGYMAILFPPLAASLTARHLAERERGKIRGAFGRYLSSQVLDTVLLADAGRQMADGRRKNCAVLFIGIKDFNDLARRVTPTELQKILNRFFKVIVDTSFKHGATLDKIMGGSMMVFFGDPIDQPDQHERAIAMARDVVAAVKSNGLDLRVGVGIEYGEVVVGNLGGKEFVSYTCIGDRVNLAARLESMSKDGEILIGPGLAAQLPGEEMESLGEISIKGKQEPVEAFRLGTRLT